MRMCDCSNPEEGSDMDDRRAMKDMNAEARNPDTDLLAVGNLQLARY